jgi:hypothetical protein
VWKRGGVSNELFPEMKPKTKTIMKTIKKVATDGPVPLSFALRHSFLGRGILNELRILMRLAMSPTGEPNRTGRLLERDPISF